jgi:hypothetical protein
VHTLRPRRLCEGFCFLEAPRLHEKGLLVSDAVTDEVPYRVAGPSRATSAVPICVRCTSPLSRHDACGPRRGAVIRLHRCRPRRSPRGAFAVILIGLHRLEEPLASDPRSDCD